MTVNVANAVVNAFKPAQGDPATATRSRPPLRAPPPRRRRRSFVRAAKASPSMRPRRSRICSCAFPQASIYVVRSQRGNVNVTDIIGGCERPGWDGRREDHGLGIRSSLRARWRCQSSTMGATRWPGTLHISSDTGDVTVYVPETAAFHVRMHTDDGVLFTDFDLRGTSHGHNETIDSNVNSGSAFGLDLEVAQGCGAPAAAHACRLRGRLRDSSVRADRARF